MKWSIGRIVQLQKDQIMINWQNCTITKWSNYDCKKVCSWPHEEGRSGRPLLHKGRRTPFKRVRHCYFQICHININWCFLVASWYCFFVPLNISLRWIKNDMLLAARRMVLFAKVIVARPLHPVLHIFRITESNLTMKVKVKTYIKSKNKRFS